VKGFAIAVLLAAPLLGHIPPPGTNGSFCGNRVKQRSDVIFDCDLSNLTESHQTCIVKPFLTTKDYLVCGLKLLRINARTSTNEWGGKPQQVRSGEIGSFFLDTEYTFSLHSQK
jgi:hypothetical protein